jgi:hypothetical protein
LSSQGISDNPRLTQLAVAQQSDIGWHLLLEGWVAIEWELLQKNIPPFFDPGNLVRDGWQPLYADFG